jgi:hypothetical protein
MAIELKEFISQSLSPAIAISGVGLLTLGLSNRIATLGLRIRQLNRELKQADSGSHRDNLRQQILLFMHRARAVRNSLFLLYTAIGLIVTTEVAIAMRELGMAAIHNSFPIFSFLLALVVIFIAVIFEAYETILNVHSLDLDVEHGFSGNDDANSDERPSAPF